MWKRENFVKLAIYFQPNVRLILLYPITVFPFGVDHQIAVACSTVDVTSLVCLQIPTILASLTKDYGSFAST